MSSPPPERRFTVLVVEDDMDHAALIQAAFSYSPFPCRLHVTGSSEEAIEYLLGQWPFENRLRHPLPDVIILDIGLPGMDGLGFLRWMSTREESWSHTPVVVFTGASDRTTVSLAFDLGAREVKVKPDDFNKLVEAVTDVLRRWRPHIA